MRPFHRWNRNHAISDNGKGILWALLATGVFAVVAAMAKTAVDEYHVLQILFFRQVVVLLSSLPKLAKGFPGSLRTAQAKLHCVRLIGAFIALSCGIWAVAILPLSTAITLSFAQVLFVVLISSFFLNEPISATKILAVLTGFLGVFVVMRPTPESTTSLYAFVPILGALGAAIAMTTVRRLSQTETTQALLFYQSAFVGLFAAMAMPWVWKTPSFYGLTLLLSMGVLAAIGQWLGIKALRLGEASVIGSIQYTQILYAVTLGVVFFAEIPDPLALSGGALIVAAAFMASRR